MLSRPSLNDLPILWCLLRLSRVAHCWGFQQGADKVYSLLTSSFRDALIPERNVPLTIFRLPGNPTLSRSFTNAFTGDFARFEAQLR